MSVPKGTYNKTLYDKIGKFYRTFFPGNGAALKFKGSDKLYTLKSIKTADPRWVFCADRQTQLGDFLKDITKLETINGKPVVYDWSLNEMEHYTQLLLEKLEQLTNCKISLTEAKIDNYEQMNNQLKTSAAFSVTMEELVQIAMDNGIDLAPFEPSEVIKGMQVELEHGVKNPKTDVTHNDLLETLKIVVAHLEEMSDYYTHLERMERLNEKMIQKLESLTGKKVILEGLEWEPTPSDNKDLIGVNHAGSLPESYHHNLMPTNLENYINNTFYVYDEDQYRGTITIEETKNLDKQRYTISYNAMNGVVSVVPVFEQTKENAARATEIQNELTKVISVPRKIKETSTPTAGNYSTEQMEEFLKEITNLVDFNVNEVRITIPSNYPSSSINTTKEQINANWEKAKQLYGDDPTVKWFVWDASVGGSLNKPKELRSQRYDIQSILDIIRKYPEALRGLNIGVVSNSKDKMDKSISTQGD